MITYNSKKILSIFIIVASFAGYEFIVSILDIIGLKTREFSIFLRALILLASLILLFTNIKFKIKNFFRVRFDRLEILFISFWILYIARLIYTTISNDQTLYMEISDYWIWAILVCFIPASSILLLTRKQALGIMQDIPACIYLVLYITIISFSILFVNNFCYENNYLINKSLASLRFEIPSLNPISIANICAISLLLPLIRKIDDFYQFKFTGKIFFLILAFFFLIISNSKGSIIAIILPITYIFFRNKNQLQAAINSAIFFVVAIILHAQILNFFKLPNRISNFLSLLQYLSPARDSSKATETYSAAESQIANIDLSTLDRLSRYKSSLDQILQSPFIGSSIELNGGGGYPHNLLLEILLCTGITGLFFAGLLFFLVLRKGLATKLDRHTEFMFTIFIFYLVFAQFSGSIYTSAGLWISLSLLVALFKKN